MIVDSNSWIERRAKGIDLYYTVKARGKPLSNTESSILNLLFAFGVFTLNRRRKGKERKGISSSNTASYIEQ